MTAGQAGDGWRGPGRGRGPRWLGGLLGWALAVSGACDSRGARDPGSAASCPACVCTCEDGKVTAAAAPAGPARADCPACVCSCERGGEAPVAGASGSTELFESAMRKMNHDDGAGCLADLDAFDRAEPRRRSSDPQNTQAMTRAQCLMIAGQCEPGKALLRETYQNIASMAKLGPEQLERTVEAMASASCRGAMSPRDELLQGMLTLSNGAHMKRMTVAECEDAYQKVLRNRAVVRPRDADDQSVISAGRDLFAVAPGCFARAGDCGRARAVFDERFPGENLAGVQDPKARADAKTATFEAMVAKCKK